MDGGLRGGKKEEESREFDQEGRGWPKGEGGNSPLGLLAREGRLNVIKEGGGTPSCNPPPPLSSRCTYSRYGKYRVGEFHGDVSGSCTYESGITEAAGGRTSWGLGRVGQRKTSLFPEHFTPFPPAGACCRPLKGRIRVRRLPPRSLSRCPPVPRPPPLRHIPFSRFVPFSQSTQ